MVLTIGVGATLAPLKTTIAAFLATAARLAASIRVAPVRAIKSATPSEVLEASMQPPGFQLVMSAEMILRRTGADAYLKSICERTRFGQKVFERDCMPVILGICDLVQLLPVSSSRNHHASASMLIKALTSANIALQLRLGEILPRTGASEDVHRREHRWTYGIFLCALFRDLGRLCTDMRVAYRTSDGREQFWHPIEGTLASRGAVAYRVLQPVDKETILLSTERLPLLFLHRLVSAPVLQWLANDLDLVDEIMLCLSGVAHNGALPELTRLAHEEANARTNTVAVDERIVTSLVKPSEVPRQERKAAQPSRPRERGTNDVVPSRQTELFDRYHELSNAPTAGYVATNTDLHADDQIVCRLDLPSNLTPLVREALQQIFESQCRVMGVTDFGPLDEQGWFVPLNELEKKGVDTGLALKCLMEIGALYLGEKSETRKVHVRSIEEIAVRGIIIKSTCIGRGTDKVADR